MSKATSTKIPPLKEREDWILWSRRMKAMLRREELEHCLSKPVKEDDTGERKALTEKQKKENNKAVSIILINIDDEQMNYFDDENHLYNI